MTLGPTVFVWQATVEASNGDPTDKENMEQATSNPKPEYKKSDNKRKGWLGPKR